MLFIMTVNYENSKICRLRDLKISVFYYKGYNLLAKLFDEGIVNNVSRNEMFKSR